MVAFDATEVLTPYRVGRAYGAILFDGTRFRQAEPEWLQPAHWAGKARPVGQGGRGSAWFVEAPFGPSVLRLYRRGGLAAHFSPDRYLWHGSDRTRSFAEFRLTRLLHARGLPVPRALVASYLREGPLYRAALLLERLQGVQSLAERALAEGAEAPWEQAGRLVARFHRAGLDHVDLNAHNLLFDDAARGWMIDFDRCRLRIPATGWRESNLKRLHRSLLKLRGARTPEAVARDMACLRQGYDAAWERGY